MEFVRSDTGQLQFFFLVVITDKLYIAYVTKNRSHILDFHCVLDKWYEEAVQYETPDINNHEQKITCCFRMNALLNVCECAVRNAHTHQTQHSTCKYTMWVIV